MASIELTVSAILFDSDGTLIDSTPAVRATIQRWCAAQGVDPRAFAAAQHGTRARDLLRRFAVRPKRGSEMSEVELDEAVEELEREVGRTASRMAQQGEGGIVMLPGVAKLLEKLREGAASWGIETSGASSSSRSLRLEPAHPLLRSQGPARTPAPLSSLRASCRARCRSLSSSRASSSRRASLTPNRSSPALQVRTVLPSSLLALPTVPSTVP